MVFIIDGKDYSDMIPVRHDQVSIHGGSVDLLLLEAKRREKQESTRPTVAER